MYGGILFRMIFWELVKVFLLALVGITGILLVAGVIAEATQQGLGPKQILSAIPLLIPSTLPYTIPATTLFAVCVVYGRLAADNEVLAIRAAGVNLFTVVAPAIVLGIAMTAVTMLLYFRVIPETHHMLRSLVFRDAEELIYTVLKRQGVLQHNSLPYAMYVKGVQGRKLINPVFKHLGPDGRPNLVAYGKEADLRVNLAKRVVHLYMRHGEATSENGDTAWFEERTFDVPLGDNFGKQGVKRQREMTWEELHANAAEKGEQLRDIEQDIATTQAEVGQPGASETLPAHVENLRNTHQRVRLEKVNLEVEVIMRLSLSFGCLCFILIGCPVGIWFNRADFLSSFITCFLPVVIVYYPLMLAGTGIAREGKINPWLLVFGANLVVGSLGLLLTWRLTRT